MSIFEKPSDQEGTVNEDADNTEMTSDELENLVGEGKKYATVEDALKSLPHKEQHISRIEQENADLRKKLAEELAKVKDTLDELRGQRDEPKDKKSELDPDALAKLIDSRLTAKTEEQKRKENEAKVINTLVERYGSVKAAEEAYVKKATELGLGVETFNELSGRSPKAVLSYFGGSSEPSGAGLTKPTVNTEAHIEGSDQRTYSYWEKWRKQNGNANYYSEKIQKMIDRDMKRLGSKFFD